MKTIMSLEIQAKALFIPLLTTFKQASSVRNLGASIWCEVNRGHLNGLGEGCPRIYATGEKVASALEWIYEYLNIFQNECTTLSNLTNWISDNRKLIDQHPAAFCAIETALLDLFAKENNQSVESLIGLANPERSYYYTAILGDSNKEAFIKLVKRYIATGLSDFKVKIMGELIWGLMIWKERVLWESILLE